METSRRFNAERARVRANIVLLQADHQDGPDTPRRGDNEVAMARDVLHLMAELDYDPEDPNWGTKEKSSGQLRRVIRRQHHVHREMYRTIKLLEERLTAAEAALRRGWSLGQYEWAKSHPDEVSA